MDIRRSLKVTEIPAVIEQVEEYKDVSGKKKCKKN